MKYDIYKGKQEDMGEGGDIQLEKCNVSQVKEFCKCHEINFERFIEGDYINGFWLEEAMNY